MAAFVTRTVGDVVSEILMSRAAFDGSFLVLEGDSDSKFWSRRIARAQCQIVIAGSKPTVMGAIVRAIAVSERGTLGIVDDDYDSLIGTPLPCANIFRTDARDLEAMLVRSAALEAVIHEVGDAAKIASFERLEGVTVREALVVRSLLFGKLRWLDKQKGWRFNFDRLSPWRFADVPNWRIDEPGVITTMANELRVAEIDLRNSLAALPAVDPFLILRGKDTADILAMGLRNKLGNHQHPVERVVQMLRLAFDDAMARATKLFHEILNWEAGNVPYRVLS